ncbi:hypothetical protein ARSEF4850_006860 [Beauveria asiatica]
MSEYLMPENEEVPTLTKSNTTTAYTSQSSDGPPLEKTTSRFARALAFCASSPEGKEKERERAEKREACLGVQVAIVMGARVIAMGRSEEKLAKLKEDVKRHSQAANIETVKITGDVTNDTAALLAFGVIDAVLDMTPSSASMSTHTKSAIRALHQGGRVSLMGSTKNTAVPEIMTNSIMLRGKLMYDRESVIKFVKMLERGLFPKGDNFAETRTFKLDDWKTAFDVGAEHNGIGKCVAFTP